LPLFCAIDADSILEREALARIVRPFPGGRPDRGGRRIIRMPTACTVQSGLVTKVGMPRNILARIQVLEYLRSFLGRPLRLGSTNAIDDHLRRVSGSSAAPPSSPRAASTPTTVGEWSRRR